MIYKYRYLGTGEVHLPKFGITAKEGEIIESKQPIENPDFELVIAPVNAPETKAKSKK